MEELKILVEMVASLPTMAIWVLIGFFIYKVVIVGSVFGVIRLAIIKTHSVLVSPRPEKPPKPPTVVHDSKLGPLCIEDAHGPLIGQISRAMRSTGKYLHRSDVKWLSEAIDLKEQKEKEETK